MADATPLFDFTSGGQAAEEFQKKEKAAAKAARGRASYVSSLLKEDGDTVILRFVTDEPDWIWTKQHLFVNTKAAPKDKPNDSDWPKSVSAVCRRTPIGPEQRPAYPVCIIDSRKNDRGWPERPQTYLWAGAVLREELIGSEELAQQGRIHPTQVGKRVVIDQQELVDEVDKTGTSTGRQIWKRAFVIVNMRLDNFFSPLTSAAKYQGTILDRDYRITRKGLSGQKGAQFVPTALDPYDVSVERDGQIVQIRYDLREPEIAAIYADGAKEAGVDRESLHKKISWMVSDTYYGLYFDERVEASWEDRRQGFTNDDDNSSSSEDAPPPPPSAQQQEGKSVTQEPTAGVTAEGLAAMRAKVMGGAATPAPAAAAVPLVS